MSLFEVGRLCLKIAGRDAGRTCVIVEQVDNTFVVVDGDVRRKKVNVKHLEPMAEVVELSNKASATEVQKLFESRGLPVWRHTAKKVGARPMQVRAHARKAAKGASAKPKAAKVDAAKVDAKPAANKAAKKE